MPIEKIIVRNGKLYKQYVDDYTIFGIHLLFSQEYMCLKWQVIVERHVNSKYVVLSNILCLVFFVFICQTNRK